jgi:hypothetical protein
VISPPSTLMVAAAADGKASSLHVDIMLTGTKTPQADVRKGFVDERR